MLEEPPELSREGATKQLETVRVRSLLAERTVCTKVRRTRECIRVIRVGERVSERQSRRNWRGQVQPCMPS